MRALRESQRTATERGKNESDNSFISCIPADNIIIVGSARWKRGAPFASRVRCPDYQKCKAPGESSPQACTKS